MSLDSTSSLFHLYSLNLKTNVPNLFKGKVNSFQKTLLSVLLTSWKRRPLLIPEKPRRQTKSSKWESEPLTNLGQLLQKSFWIYNLQMSTTQFQCTIIKNYSIISKYKNTSPWYWATVHKVDINNARIQYHYQCQQLNLTYFFNI